MSLGVRIRLSVMMFLQYYVWGIWLPMLGQHLGKNDLNLDVHAIGWIFTVYGFGAIFGPFVLGELADRHFATEKIMAAAHLVGGFLLIGTASATTFWPIFILLLLYCSLYMATMSLSNSITFRTLGAENQGHFPIIRLWGTIGWIAAGLSFAAYLKAGDVPFLEPLFAIPWIGAPAFRDCLRIAGVVSILYALYCLTLPHTPPIPASATDPIEKKSAIIESLGLMRYRSFAVLVVIAGLIGIMLAFYFACETFFLESIGIKPEDTGAYMTIGQIAEFAVMALVPLSVARLGVKKTMIIGASAWALRFGLSAYGQPKWLMIATIALHGFAFGFFFVVAQMYVDRAASKDIKATAQSFLMFVVYGLGTVVGSVLTGWIRNFNTSVVNGVQVESWRGIWLGPFLLTIACIVAFALLFREREIGADVKEPEPVLS
jgi:nucleoside transporter